MSIIFYLLSSLVALLYSMYLGRVLGSSGLGKINLFLLLLSTSNIFLNLGIGQSLVYFLSSRKYAEGYLVLSSLLFTLSISIISALIFYFSSSYIIKYFDQLSSTWFYILIVSLPFVNLKSLAEYYFAAYGNFYLNSGLNFIDLLLKLLLSIILVYFCTPINAFFFSIVIVTLIVGIFPWLKILRDLHIRRFVKVEIFNKSFLIQFFGFGLSSYISVLIGFLSLRIDQLLIGAYLSNFDLGIYIVAVIFAELPFKVSNAITKVLFAKVSEEKYYNPKFTGKVLRVILIISILIIFAIIIIGRPLINILYGQEFAKVYQILVILLPGSFFFNFTQILHSDLSGRGYPIFGMRSGLYTLLFSVFLNISIIPFYGILGVAVVSSITYLLSSLLMIYYYFQKTNISFRNFFTIRQSDFNFLNLLNGK